jgi:hypothetical protein
MIWTANSNQTLFDLAIQLYGDISYALKIAADNNLDLNTQTFTGQKIVYDLNGISTAVQLNLINNRKTIATGFLASDPPLPPVIQRSFNNDFNLDFD